jgi:hypothetical protein
MLHATTNRFTVFARNEQCEGLYANRSVHSVMTIINDLASESFPTAHIQVVARDLPTDKSNISTGYGKTQFQCDIQDPSITLDEFNDRLNELVAALRAKSFVV